MTTAERCLSAMVDCANLFVPVRHGHLRGQHQGAALIAVITDFREVAGKCCNNVERSGGMAGGFQRDSTR